MAGAADQVSISESNQCGNYTDKSHRASNLRMKILFNAHDRETGEWLELFAKADPRFRVVNNKFHNREPNNDIGPTLALIEAVWEG